MVPARTDTRPSTIGGSTTRAPTTLDGLVDLPPTKIAAVATYLEMTRREAAARPATEPLGLAPIRHDMPRYRRLYAAVGEPWLWFSRARMSDARLAAILDHPEVAALAVTEGGRDIGLLELDFRTPGQCELAFLGLVAGATGRGLGRRLVGDGIRLAFAQPVERLWLHTCTLDHPAALRTYMGAGFRPFRRAIEIADDPRLTGHMPREAGQGFPILPR